jgi:hypothetical protein
MVDPASRAAQKSLTITLKNSVGGPRGPFLAPRPVSPLPLWLSPPQNPTSLSSTHLSSPNPAAEDDGEDTSSSRATDPQARDAGPCRLPLLSPCLGARAAHGCCCPHMASSSRSRVTSHRGGRGAAFLVLPRPRHPNHALAPHTTCAHTQQAHITCTPGRRAEQGREEAGEEAEPSRAIAPDLGPGRTGSTACASRRVSGRHGP